MKLQIIVSVLLAVASPGNTRILNAIASQLSGISGTQEEVSYTLDRRTNEYEERTYPERKWACIEHRGNFNEDDEAQTFLQLFDYISGENGRGMRMPLTIPVSVQYSVMEDGEKVYDACFAIKARYQENPPTPINPAIVIKTRPQMQILTRRFGGYANEVSEWLSEARELRKELRGESVRSDIMFWNAYSSPLKFWNRRNEVWLVKN